MAALLEREELLARLALARERAGRLVLVGGEAGVGKTALVRAFTATVPVRVLTGSCERLATPAPLGPLADIAAQTGGRLAAELQAGTHARLVARTLLEELSTPTVAVLEDVHWADEATLDVLRVVSRRIAATPSLVIVTYRDDEALGEHPLQVLRGELATVDAVERLSVPPLSRTAVQALSPGSGAAIYDVSGGNAFFVTELIAADRAELPATVRDAVLTRIARLSAPARRLLEGAAVIPARAELWLLDAAFADVSDRVDECVTAGVLESRGHAVAFRHELARLVVENTLPPRRRRDLHVAVQRALERRPGVEPSRLAHHAQAAGDPVGVVRHGRAAAERGARTCAHRESAAQYVYVLAHVGADDPATRAEVLAAYAVEAQASGDYTAAITALREAAELERARGERRLEAVHLAHMTTPCVIVGRNAEADAVIAAALALLEQVPDSAETGVAWGFQAYVQMIRRDNEDAVRSAERSAALARRFENVETLALALNMLGTAHLMAGRLDTGVDVLGESLAVATAHALEHRIAHAHWMLGCGLAEMYELERGEASLRAHIDFAAEQDLDSTYTEAWLAALQVYRGRWPQAAALARDVLARPRATDVTRITANIALGRLAARRGDADAAEAALDTALALAAHGGHLQRVGHVRAARAEAAWLAGRPDAAAAEARAAYPLALAKRHLWFAGELAYWQWKAGGLAEAPDWLAEPFALQIAGRPREAAQTWRRRGTPYEAARALAESGAPDDVGAALATFEELGAEPAARAARARLRALGAPVPRGPRAASRANPGGLTSRQVEVLRLLAGGLRNADIAERLVVSRRTVDHHVSAVLHKLDARTRGEAAAAAARLGLLEER